MATLERLIVRIDGDLAGLERKLTSSEKRVVGFGRNMQSVGQRLTLGLTLPLLGVAGASANLAARAEEADSKFSAVFGENAARIRAELDRLHQTIPAARTELTQMAAGIQDLLKPLGVAPDLAADMSVATLKLAGDLASFNDVRIEEVLLAIRSGIVGQSEPLLRFGADVRKAAVEAKALELGLIDVGDELDNAARAMAVLEIVTESNVDALGDAERTAGSAANTFKFLARTLKDTGDVIGEILLPVLVPVALQIKELLEAFQGLPAPVQKGAVALGLLAATIGPLLVVGGTLVAMLPSLAAGAGILAGALAPVVAALSGPLGLVALVGAGAAAFLTFASNADAAAEATDRAAASWERMQRILGRPGVAHGPAPGAGGGRGGGGGTTLPVLGGTPLGLGQSRLFGGPTRSEAEAAERDFRRSVARTARSLEPLARGSEEGGDELGRMARIASTVGPALGDLGSIASRALSGFAAGGLMGLGGSLASTVTGFLGQLFGGTESVLEENTRAVQQNTAALMRGLTNVRGEDLGILIKSLEAALADPNLSGFTVSPALQQVIRDLGLQVPAKEDIAAWRQLLETLKLDPFGSLGGRLSLARATLGVRDLESPEDQFGAIQGALVQSLPPALAATIAGLTPETIGTFAEGVLAQISAGTFDFELLGDLTLQEFLDVIAELESLGDAAGEAADALSDAAAVINAPSGFKVALARFRASDPALGKISLPPGSLGAGGDVVVTVERMVVESGDPNAGRAVLDQLKVAIEEEAALGGADSLNLGTRARF